MEKKLIRSFGNSIEWYPQKYSAKFGWDLFKKFFIIERAWLYGLMNV